MWLDPCFTLSIFLRCVLSIFCLFFIRYVVFFLLFIFVFLFFFFFFKQKTAYELRISDWSSDVCSSDLEYGHYIVGRWCGVKADTFSIGFGRKILGWTDRRGTEWKIGWLPLGGYVQFAGDRDAVSQPDADWQQLPAEQKSHTFPAQPVWKRALIVLAGPVTNFLFAILIFAAFNMAYGVPQTPPVIGDRKSTRLNSSN